MKKWTFLGIASQFVALLLLSRPSSAWAASMQDAASQASFAQAVTITPAEPSERWQTPGYGHAHTNRQTIGGYCANRRVINSYRGNNLSNSGNRGHNSKFNQDNSGNEGNQMINQGIMGKNQGHSQYYRNCTNIEIHLYYQGNNQGNSGNSGYNDGFNQDDSGNAGNQMVN